MYTVPLYPLSAQDPETLDRGDVKIECAADLQIVEFNSTKPYKVVVTQDQTRKHEIKLKALDPTFSANYTWELGSGTIVTFKKYWNLYPNELAALDGVSYISGTFFMPPNNSDFGETNGVILLKDNSGEKDLRQAQVFFEKDAPSYWNPNEPNWSYYWKQFVDLKEINKIIFVPNIKSKCPTSEHACTAINIRDFSNLNTYYSQKFSEEIYISPTAKGLHAFLAMLAHENHHIVIAKQFWPNGYTGNQDLDGDGILDDEDGDTYPNWFETSDIGKKYKFKLNNKFDKFGGIEILDDGTEVLSSGTMYEEDECNKIALGINQKIYDKLDWSFDVKNLFQGKNWQK